MRFWMYDPTIHTEGFTLSNALLPSAGLCKLYACTKIVQMSNIFTHLIIVHFNYSRAVVQMNNSSNEQYSSNGS